MASRCRTSLAAVLVSAALTGCATGGGSVEGTSESRSSTTATVSPKNSTPARSADTTLTALAPRRARTAREVATQIEAAERAIADPRTPPARVAAAGRTQQLAYRVLATRPDWDHRVRALVPRWVQRLVAANVGSRREFRSMHGELSRTLPAWRIVRPVPAPELLRHYREAERRFGVDWEFLAAINLVETGMGRIRGTSVAGAQGPMQFMPATWAAYGVGDVRDPRDAVLGAGRYLEAMGYRSGDRPAVDQALFRYNNHPAYVRGVRLLAEVMQQRPRSYRGYHAWEVYYLTARGDVLLPVGYDEREQVPVDAYPRRPG
ncbi:MAG: lytic transglycosylase protein [Nocardioides sp.]|jgi:membrane-bound lytic murein transglycosylase B|nr:lytic transglycosylase protein [Nocardioides sp.]